MTKSILSRVYKSYYLEGIPAYPSFFIPIDFQTPHWMDTSDVARFRKERHYFPRDPEKQSGIHYYTVGTGADGIQFHRSYWDGKISDETESDFKSPLPSYEEWLEKIASRGKDWVEKGKRGQDDCDYQGVEVDDAFGNVHVVVMQKVLRASDIYLGMPLEIEVRIDMDMFRIVEQTERVVVNEDGKIDKILHHQLRLSKWVYLEPDEAPDRLFDPEHIVSE